MFLVILDMLKIFKEDSNAFKILNIIVIIKAALLNACAISDDELVREKICGKRYNTGATFATEKDAKEAITRGVFDTRNPFVSDVCGLTYSTQETKSSTTLTQATITRVALDIFLCCRHTAIGLQYAMRCLEKNYLKIYVQLDSDTQLEVTQPTIITHPNADLALMKLQIRDKSFTASSLLPITEPLDDKTEANGFVVSYSDVSVIGNCKRLAAMCRTLSIHRFKSSGQTLVYTLDGKIAECLVTKMAEICSLNPINRQRLIPITKEAEIEFPATYCKASLRLMSVLHQGCSGAPLIIKIYGNFVILGIHTNGGISSKNFGNFSEDKACESVWVTYVNNFLNLTEYSNWIAENVNKLRVG